MAKNEFLPFGTAEGANVLAAPEYENLAARHNGFTSGVAKSKELNKVWRQASLIASAVAQFIVDTDQKDLLDTGDVANIKNRLVSALNLIISNGDYVTNPYLKLELLKKIDKADIAQQLGNDTNKVPSLDLVARELGKKASTAVVDGKLAKDQNGADIADPILFVKNLGLSDGNYVGRLLSSPKVFTSSGTYTPTPGAKCIRITMTGGGGGGGGCQASANNETYFGAGGGAGATVISMFTLTGAANYPLAIGSGGTGGAAAANGSNGGTTSFSTIFSAPGGEGGGKSGVSNTNGGAGGVPTNGDIRLIGGYGGDGQSGLIAVTGQGGVSYFGGGGRAGVGSGVNGSSPGSGGGGSYDSAYSGIAMKGGTGASGIIIIEEFA